MAAAGARREALYARAGGGHHVYIRQLRDIKIKFPVETIGIATSSVAYADQNDED